MKQSRRIRTHAWGMAMAWVRTVPDSSFATLEPDVLVRERHDAELTAVKGAARRLREYQN
jgi:hypothetical protein